MAPRLVVSEVSGIPSKFALQRHGLMFLYFLFMAKKYKRYQKDFSFSYATGFYPALELLTRHPEWVEAVFVSGKGMDGEGFGRLLEIVTAHDLYLEENQRLVEALSDRGNNPVVVAFRKEEQQLDSNASHLILHEPDTMGNLGTILRAGLGFGLRDVAIIRPGVDSWDPKVVRASMGARFAVNVQYFDSFEAYLEAFPRPCFALALAEEALPLEEVSFPPVCGVVFGNEGAGLPVEVVNSCQAVRIRHSTEIDSLNLATAAAITLYEIQRQRGGSNVATQMKGT